MLTSAMAKNKINQMIVTHVVKCGDYSFFFFFFFLKGMHSLVNVDFFKQKQDLSLLIQKHSKDKN